MKKMSILIDKSLQKTWGDWIGTSQLNDAMRFPHDFMCNMAGKRDRIDRRYRNFLSKWFSKDGENRKDILAAYEKSNRMAIVLSDWQHQVFIDLSLYGAASKESLFRLVIIFSERGVDYSLSEPPLPA
jgi:hypothetical protein